MCPEYRVSDPSISGRRPFRALDPAAARGRAPRSRPDRPAVALLLATLVVPFAPSRATGQEPRPAAGTENEALGAVDFRVSCAPGVQADFDRAVALLHHMMYADAGDAFRAIAGRDPGCAMAHWGIAMTRFQPLWPARPDREALTRGWEDVQRASALGVPTDRERALVDVAEAFFREPETADYWTRIGRWAEAMERAHRAHPDDRETAAFYALSLLAVGRVAEDPTSHSARAAEILLRIYDEEPTHPGAIHYTIHANDVAGRAHESLPVVRSYGDIAPDVPHALHMPSHIFLRLGDWTGVIEWNLRATEAALRISAGSPVARCGHHPHNPAYLLYAHLQRGEDEKARRVLEAAMEEMRAKERFQQEFVCAFHLAEMPARYVVERRAWDEAAGLKPRTPASLEWDLHPWPEALTWFARGLGAVRSGDASAAGEAEARMRELRSRAEELGEPAWTAYIEVDRRILAAWIAHAEGRAAEAVELARAAAELDETAQKDPVTPGALYPPHEALGDLLLEMERPAEALEAYKISLRLWPGRFHGLLGAARAARAAGEDAKARACYGELLVVAADSGARRPAVREAREFLAGAGGTSAGANACSTASGSRGAERPA